MATWPSNPNWIDPSNINGNNQYSPGDGVTADDMNDIVKDMIYLAQQTPEYITQPLDVTPSTFSQEITAPTGVNGFDPVRVAPVTSSIDPGIRPENIKSGVSILGVQGVLPPSGSGGIIPAGNVQITNTDLTDVTNYATAQVVDANLVAENIKQGVSILGIPGSFAGSGFRTPVGLPRQLRIYYTMTDSTSSGITIYFYGSNTPFTGTEYLIKSETIYEGDGYIDVVMTDMYSWLNIQYSKFREYGTPPSVAIPANTEYEQFAQLASASHGIASYVQSNMFYGAMRMTRTAALASLVTYMIIMHED